GTPTRTPRSTITFPCEHRRSRHSPRTGPRYARPMGTREAARRWAATWERGWRDPDATEILALYADGATLQSHPFRRAIAPADYIVPTLAEEASADCEFGEPIVDGDRAAVEWRGDTRLKDGGDGTARRLVHPHLVTRCYLASLRATAPPALARNRRRTSAA